MSPITAASSQAGTKMASRPGKVGGRREGPAEARGAARQPEKIHRQIAEPQDQEPGGGEQRGLAHDEVDGAEQRSRNVHGSAPRADPTIIYLRGMIGKYFSKALNYSAPTVAVDRLDTCD
jgi:hypothetical protein